MTSLPYTPPSYLLPLYPMALVNLASSMHLYSQDAAISNIPRVSRALIVQTFGMVHFYSSSQMTTHILWPHNFLSWVGHSDVPSELSLHSILGSAVLLARAVTVISQIVPFPTQLGG